MVGPRVCVLWKGRSMLYIYFCFCTSRSCVIRCLVLGGCRGQMFAGEESGCLGLVACHFGQVDS